MSNMKTKLGFVIICFMIELVTDSPGISIGFSETGEAVVLTLVDSASQELQQQAAVVTKLLAAGADAANQSAHTKVVAAAAAAAAAGPVTVPLPLQSDANQTNQDDDDLYVVRAEPKQVDATSQPTRASEQQPSSDGVGSQSKSGNEGTTASESLLPSQDTVVEDVIVGGEGQEKVGTKSNETGVVNSTSGGSAGGGGGAGEVVSSSHEEIPSFSEWAQKQLAEAEKKKSENKTRGSGAGGAGGGVGGGAGGAVKRGSKQRSKNYASPDCGAKVVSTNPEASSVWAVLSTSRDEYLLNSCHNKIWFVVELCEAIQPEKIELANFELFSSILREFSVSVSDRHPSREWSGVGQMEAREVRTVQSFSLQPTSAFVKYIRVEFHSHYGAEHYCPISLFRVYGTSEFEVLDTVDEAHAAVASLEEEEEEEFDDEEAGVGGGEGVEKPRNLFSSARDAVLSIVKRAAQALGKGDGGEGGVGSGSLEGQGNSSVGEGDATALVNCVTPAHIIVCDNCSDALYNRVHHELSCHLLALERVLGWEWGGAAVAGSGACKARGLGGGGGAPFPMLARTSPAPLAAHPSSHYLHAMLPEHTIIALCNLLAIKRKQVVLNITYDLSKDFGEKIGESLGEAATVAPLMPLTSASPSTCTVNSTTAASSASQDAGSGSGATGSKDSQSASNTQIKPTKTFLAEDMHSLPVDADVSNLNTTSDGEGLNATTVADSVPVVTASSAPVKATTEDQTATATESLGSEESMLDFPEEAAGGGLTFDSIFSELDEVESADPVAVTTSTTQPTKLSPPQTQQRESVFLRLAKRIKALERNMSLSGQYLEELSRRYKRQVEEMQRSLNEVVEERRRQEERELHRGEQVATLTRQLTKLTSTMEALIEERNSWAIKHGAVIVVEVVVFAVILLLCRCLPDAVELGGRSRRLVAWQRSAPSGSSAAPRRSSVDGSSRPYPPNPRLRKRRPSEEALRISGSTHEDLLIPDASRKNSRAENRRRRRKKKEQQAAAATTTTFYVDVDTSSSSSVRQMAAGPPPPPPPLPPPVVAVRPVVAAPAERRSYIVPVTVNGGDPSSLPAPPSILAPPSPPNYVQTALSIRKKRKESLRGQSSSEFSDSSAPSASSAMLNNLSSPSLLAKKSGPLKKIIKKLF